MRDLGIFEKDADDADKNDSFFMDDNLDIYERFDSRGKKMQLRRGKVMNAPMDRLPKSYAVVNFHP